MRIQIFVSVLSGCLAAGCLLAQDATPAMPAPAAKPAIRPAVKPAPKAPVKPAVKNARPVVPVVKPMPKPVGKPVPRPGVKAALPAGKSVQKTAAATMTIPKDAVETSPGFYKWTDKDGKSWTYRLSPFGATRWPSESVDARQDAADKTAATVSRTVAIPQGDSIRFEQSTPFGKRTWVRKKTELTETEQQIAAHTAEKE